MPYTTHIDEVKGAHFDAPFERVIKHLYTPWDHDAKFLWMGMSEVPAGSASNPHKHENQEEVFFVYEGSGHVIVDGVEIAVRPGSLVAVRPGELHQLRASTTEALRTLNSVAPPFKPEDFARVHDPNS